LLEEGVARGGGTGCGNSYGVKWKRRRQCGYRRKELYEGIGWSFLYLLPSLVVVVVKMEFIGMVKV
jgi:hypothetical protein